MLKSADKLYVFFLLLELARLLLELARLLLELARLLLELARLLLELARLSFHRKVSFVRSHVPYLSGPQVIN